MEYVRTLNLFTHTNLSKNPYNQFYAVQKFLLNQSIDRGDTIKQDILSVWYKRVECSQKCHYLASHRFDRYNYYLGVPTILITALVGTSVFASLQTSYSKSSVILVGLVSVLGAVLSSLQTFLSFNERAERHRSAGARFGALGRKLELLLSEKVEFSHEEAMSLKEEIDRLGADSPKIPPDILRHFHETHPDEIGAYGPIIDLPEDKNNRR